MNGKIVHMNENQLCTLVVVFNFRMLLDSSTQTVLSARICFGHYIKDCGVDRNVHCTIVGITAFS